LFAAFYAPAAHFFRGLGGFGDGRDACCNFALQSAAIPQAYFGLQIATVPLVGVDPALGALSRVENHYVVRRPAIEPHAETVEPGLRLYVSAAKGMEGIWRHWTLGGSTHTGKPQCAQTNPNSSVIPGGAAWGAPQCGQRT
jgi:hypothetical protein